MSLLKSHFSNWGKKAEVGEARMSPLTLAVVQLGVLCPCGWHATVFSRERDDIACFSSMLALSDGKN